VRSSTVDGDCTAADLDPVGGHGQHPYPSVQFEAQPWLAHEVETDDAPCLGQLPQRLRA
jgi:hypothetical protein